jgi:predicted DNA-binding transcriptional regulator AlpA
MTEATIERLISQVAVLANAVETLSQNMGTRLTRAELVDRLKIHRNTLATWLATDRHFPRPDKTGRWLLADVVAWELNKNGGAQ